MFTRLTKLTADAADWNATRNYALRWLAVNPLSPGPHRSAAAAAEQLGDDRLTLDSLEALLALQPIDPADLHFRLAAVLKRTGELQSAKQHALLALEETPRFRAAHRQLLEIVRELEGTQERD